MFVDKMREVQLVAESKLLEIDPITKTFSRYDKTVYILEPIPSTLKVSGAIPEYVEAAKFFALYSEAESVSLEQDYCLVTLKNGAQYKLPYFADLSWERKSAVIDGVPSITLKLAGGRLSSATLKNLANPLLQCIYIDGETGVSCNSMVACIDGTVTSAQPLILPPDVVTFIDGIETTLYILDEGKTYLFKKDDAMVFVPVPEQDYSGIADALRQQLPINVETKYAVTGLIDSLKRLSVSHDTVSFDKDKVFSGEDYEPFTFPCAIPDYAYSIQNLLTVLPQVKAMVQTEYSLVLYGDQFLFMISPEGDIADSEVEVETEGDEE